MKLWLGVKLVHMTALGNVVDLVGVYESLTDRPSDEGIRYVPLDVGVTMPGYFDLWEKGHDLRGDAPISTTITLPNNEVSQRPCGHEYQAYPCPKPTRGRREGN